MDYSLSSFRDSDLSGIRLCKETKITRHEGNKVEIQIKTNRKALRKSKARSRRATKRKSDLGNQLSNSRKKKSFKALSLSCPKLKSLFQRKANRDPKQRLTQVQTLIRAHSRLLLAHGIEYNRQDNSDGPENAEGIEGMTPDKKCRVQEKARRFTPHGDNSERAEGRRRKACRKRRKRKSSSSSAGTIAAAPEEGAAIDKKGSETIDSPPPEFVLTRQPSEFLKCSPIESFVFTGTSGRTIQTARSLHGGGLKIRPQVNVPPMHHGYMDCGRDGLADIDIPCDGGGSGLGVDDIDNGGIILPMECNLHTKSGILKEQQPSFGGVSSSRSHPQPFGHSPPLMLHPPPLPGPVEILTALDEIGVGGVGGSLSLLEDNFPGVDSLIEMLNE
eukprot:jgi/Bigna1/82356/fgenesh1_pg.91_\